MFRRFGNKKFLKKKLITLNSGSLSYRGGQRNEANSSTHEFIFSKTGFQYHY